MNPDVVGSKDGSGLRYCAAYQRPRPGLGQIACVHTKWSCPFGLHSCYRCGKPGHGEGNCNTKAPVVVPSPRRTLPTSSDAPALKRQRPTVDVSNPADLVELTVWRPSRTHRHGFACMFQFACSVINRSIREKFALFIDLNQSNTLYDSFATPLRASNWWSDIFTQPFEHFLPIDEKERIQHHIQNLRDHDYDEAVAKQFGIKLKILDPELPEIIFNTSGVFSPSRDGGLNEEKVHQGRGLFSQHVRLTDDFCTRLLTESSRLRLTESILAVHLRRTDKSDEEAPENNTLGVPFIVEKIKDTMSGLGCTSVFLCTDDKFMKREIKEELDEHAVECITYNATLSDNNRIGLHFSEAVPKSKQLKDVSLEVMMMASCRGLLCTRSNMSFMVAVMSDDSFEVIDIFTDRRISLAADWRSSAASSSTKAPVVVVRKVSTVEDATAIDDSQDVVAQMEEEDDAAPALQPPVKQSRGDELKTLEDLELQPAIQQYMLARRPFAEALNSAANVVLRTETLSAHDPSLRSMEALAQKREGGLKLFQKNIIAIRECGYDWPAILNMIAPETDPKFKEAWTRWTDFVWMSVDPHGWHQFHDPSAHAAAPAAAVNDGQQSLKDKEVLRADALRLWKEICSNSGE